VTAAPPPTLVRSPRFWAVRLGVLAAAVAAGLALQGVVAARLAAIQALANDDVLRARAELAGLLRVGSVLLFGLTGAVGASIALSSRRAVAEQRFPPSGVWSWGAPHVRTGPTGVRMARVGTALGVLLVLLSALAGGLTWHIAAVLLACRAA
jgi:hypothetical protein